MRLGVQCLLNCAEPGSRNVTNMCCLGCSYAQSALAVNEFLAPRWQIVRPSATSYAGLAFADLVLASLRCADLQGRVFLDNAPMPQATPLAGGAPLGQVVLQQRSLPTDGYWCAPRSSLLSHVTCRAALHAVLWGGPAIYRCYKVQTASAVRACRVWLGAVALIGYTVLFNLLVVVAQTKLNRACLALLSYAVMYQHAFVYSNSTHHMHLGYVSNASVMHCIIKKCVHAHWWQSCIASCTHYLI